MGTSTGAILVFGIELEEEHEPWGRDQDEWLEKDGREILGLQGEKQYEILEQHPVEIIQHCSYEYPMYILAVRETEKRAWRGEPFSIDVEDLRIPIANTVLLKAFCERHDIEWKEPKWLLCSMWG
jgi:hypothetical protein